jgi:hypothetical protein
VRRLRAAPEAEVGMALLDQRNLAGLGNLYRTEVLFLRGLTPWVRVADVPDLPAVVETGRRLMDANRGRWEQSTTGSLRAGEHHWVFERAGRPCRRCGRASPRPSRGSARAPGCPTGAPAARSARLPRRPAPGPPRPPARPHEVRAVSRNAAPALGVLPRMTPCTCARTAAQPAAAHPAAQPLARRTVLTAAGAVGAVGLLAACGGAAQAPSRRPRRTSP